MRTIDVSSNKTLKLINTVHRMVGKEEWQAIDIAVTKLDNYILSKGAKPIGPIIQHMHPRINDDGEVEIEVEIIRQADRYIVHADAPYSVDSLFRVSNCLFAHYTGPENNLGIASDKLNVYAFEHELQTSGSCYTVYLAPNGDDMAADIFMELKSEKKE